MGLGICGAQVMDIPQPQPPASCTAMLPTCQLLGGHPRHLNATTSHSSRGQATHPDGPEAEHYLPVGCRLDPASLTAKALFMHPL
jgi:hypothetical protein